MIFGLHRIHSRFHINHHFIRKTIANYPAHHIVLFSRKSSLSPSAQLHHQAGWLAGVSIQSGKYRGLVSLRYFIVPRKLGSILAGCPRDIQHLATVSRLTWSSSQSYLTFNMNSHKLNNLYFFHIGCLDRNRHRLSITLNTNKNLER